MKLPLIVVLVLALVSPVVAQNEAPPDSAATESSRVGRVVAGMLAGSAVGVVIGVNTCSDAFASDVLWTDEGLCGSESRWSAGRIALMGAATGALLGFVLTEPSEEVAELRIGPARHQPARMEVGIELRAW